MTLGVVPLSPLHPCNRQGCTALTRERFCETHAQQRHVEDRERRGSARERGYDSRWERYRKGFLLEHPLCEECLRHQRTTVSVVVDHVRPHQGDQFLFWEPSNHQALCVECHNRKTYQEDGAFGRPVAHRVAPGRGTP